MRCLFCLALFVGVVSLSGGLRPPLTSAQDKKPVVVKLDKFAATAPATWKNEKPANRLRKYQFKLTGAKDHPEAMLTISGEGKPGPEKNFPGWKAMFDPPEGKTVDDISKTAKWDVKGATVNVLDVTGTWKYKDAPFDPKSKLMILDDWRVIWVVFDEKDETHHFRLSGPSATVAAHAADFEKWVKSFK